MYNLKSKTNQQKIQKQIPTYRHQIDDCQMGGGLGVWVKNVKGPRSTNWQLQNSHSDVKFSLGNTVSNVVIPMCGAR